MPLAADKFGRTMSQFSASPNEAVFRAEIFPVLDAETEKGAMDWVNYECGT